LEDTNVPGLLAANEVARRTESAKKGGSATAEENRTSPEQLGFKVNREKKKIAHVGCRNQKGLRTQKSQEEIEKKEEPGIIG